MYYLSIYLEGLSNAAIYHRIADFWTRNPPITNQIWNAWWQVLWNSEWRNVKTIDGRQQLWIHAIYFHTYRDVACYDRILNSRNIRFADEYISAIGHLIRSVRLNILVTNRCYSVAVTADHCKPPHNCIFCPHIIIIIFSSNSLQ